MFNMLESYGEIYSEGNLITEIDEALSAEPEIAYFRKLLDQGVKLNVELMVIAASKDGTEELPKLWSIYPQQPEHFIFETKRYKSLLPLSDALKEFKPLSIFEFLLKINESKGNENTHQVIITFMH